MDSEIKKIKTFAKDGIRLDNFIKEFLGCTRNQAIQLIDANLVCVDGVCCTKNGLKLKKDQIIEITFIDSKPKKERFEANFEVEIIYEDDDILVLNKPAGIVVHPAATTKEPTIVDWLKQKGFVLSSLNGEERCGIVHRLDKETSGAMVVAKSNSVHLKLAKELQNREMGRYYIAIIDLPLKDNIVVEKPLARSHSNRLKIGVVKDGRYAKSAFVKIATSKDGYELIAAKLFTGRTHQIRAHLSSINRHILGDSLYGFKSDKISIPRVFLHARILYLTHPSSNKKMTFVAPIPNDLKEFIDAKFEKSIYDSLQKDRLIELFSSFN